MSKLSRYNLLDELTRRELVRKTDIGDEQSREHNSMLYHESVRALMHLSEDVMRLAGLSEYSRNERIRNVIAAFNNLHVADSFLHLKQCYDVLIEHISGKNVCLSYGDFKGRLTGQGEWFNKLLSPVKDDILDVISSQTIIVNGCQRNDAVNSMWRATQYLTFLNKVNFTGVGLEEKALQDYLLAEYNVGSLDLGSISHHLPELQSIIYDWFKDWSYDGSNPKHGPGAVADTKRDTVQKYSALGRDAKLNYLDKRSWTEIPDVPFERTSKLVFVPKNITKLRSISMEPATLQYVQQGCMHSLYDYMKSHKELRNVMKLGDQYRNRSLAYDGSITNKYATIDLSQASDSVNWALVKVLFKRTPQLLKWLTCTRSTHTILPSGETIALAKFAPMGSALCFPVESIVFAAIAKYTIDMLGTHIVEQQGRKAFRYACKTYSVYGDDIIVPTWCATTVIYHLKEFGFTPNWDKSYLTGPFKESCGGNYFCGKDITGIKFNVPFSNVYRGGVSPAAYVSLCSYANLAYDSGLTSFRLYCIHSIIDNGLSPLFSDSLDNSPAIFSPCPTNFHLRKIYRKRYQKYQYLYTNISAKLNTRNASQKDSFAHIFYQEKLRQLARPTSDEYYSNGGRRFGDCFLFDTKAAFQSDTLFVRPISFKTGFSDV